MTWPLAGKPTRKFPDLTTATVLSLKTLTSPTPQDTDARALTLHPQFAATPPRHGMIKPQDLSTCTKDPHMMSPARLACSYPVAGFTLAHDLSSLC